jgi:hypothetical protein
MARVLPICMVAALGVIVTGCAQTTWQMPGATSQQLAADMATCSQYVAENGDDAVLQARTGRRFHPRSSRRFVQQRGRTHVKGGVHGGGGSKGEGIAEAAIVLISVGATMAENAQMHDQCMIALGWTPGGVTSSPVILASNEPTDAPIGTGAEQASGAQADYPSLGLSTSDVTPVVASAMNLDNRHGVLVTAVVPGSAAGMVGLDSGDVALFYNDNPIRTGNDLATAVATATDELRGTIVVWRGEEEMRFTLLSRPLMTVN